VTLKYCLIAVVVLVAIPVCLALYFFFAQDWPMNIALTRGGIAKNLWAIIGSLVGAAVIIPFWGGIAGQMIIDRGRTPFWTSFWTLMAIWVSFYLGTMLFAGVENTRLHGYRGFVSAVEAWLFYGWFLFLLGGTLHGLLAGWFMGKEIRRHWSKQQTHR